MRSVTVKQIKDLRAGPETKKTESRIAVLSEALADLDEQLAAAWDGKISMLSNSVVSSGLFRATWKDAEKACGVKFTARYDRETLEFVPGLPDADEKYRHQNECVAAMQTAIPRGGGIVLSATSSGKTATSAMMFSKVTCDCLFVVDQLDLLYQQVKEIEAWTHETVGVVGDSEFRPARITVATIQTLHIHSKRKDFVKWFRGIDIMVVDELHEQMARRNFDVLQRIKPLAVFGLTATLQLTRKETYMKAYAFAGPVIFRFPIEEGVKRGVLAKGSVLQLLFTPVAVADGTDYQSELAVQVTENDLKLESCKALAKELTFKMHRHVVILANRKNHVKDLDDVMAGIPHRLAYGDVAVEDRNEAKELFEDEDIKLIIASGVFKKGVSIKRIDAMIDTAEMKSKNDAVQKFGRGLRLHKDKDELVYIDFGTAGDGRFAKAATSRRRAFKQAGIKVIVVKDVSSQADAILALRKFMRKVKNDSGRRSGSIDTRSRSRSNRREAKQN
jgi:superfamily II DNA or RNA helicase